MWPIVYDAPMQFFPPQPLHFWTPWGPMPPDVFAPQCPVAPIGPPTVPVPVIVLPIVSDPYLLLQVETLRRETEQLRVLLATRDSSSADSSALFFCSHNPRLCLSPTWCRRFTSTSPSPTAPEMRFFRQIVPSAAMFYNSFARRRGWRCRSRLSCALSCNRCIHR